MQITNEWILEQLEPEAAVRELVVPLIEKNHVGRNAPGPVELAHGASKREEISIDDDVLTDCVGLVRVGTALDIVDPEHVVITRPSNGANEVRWEALARQIRDRIAASERLGQHLLDYGIDL